MSTAGGAPGTAGDHYRSDVEPTTWTTTHGDVVTVWEAGPRNWRWHVTAGNGKVVGQGEGHTRKAAAVEAAERHHPKAPADDPHTAVQRVADELQAEADERADSNWLLAAGERSGLLMAVSRLRALSGGAQ